MTDATLRFLDLPSELILACLAHLSLLDLQNCLKCCNRLLSEIILTSVLIRYRREQQRAGVEENPARTSDFALSDRLDVLRRREENWLNFTPASRHILTVDFESSGIYDLTSDIYLVGDGETADPSTQLCTAVKYVQTSPGSGPFEWRRIDAGKPISDFGIALEEHDLIAFVTYTLVSNSQPPIASIDVQLLRFSTGSPHSAAARPTLHIQEVAISCGRPGMTIEIVGDNLAISLVFWSYEQRDQDTLHIYDWKTGTRRMAPVTAYNTGLVFLSTEILVVPDAVEGTLDVFRLATSGPASLTHSLHLPEIREQNTILSFQCRGEPNPRSQIRRPSHSQFPARSADALLLFTFEVSSRAHGVTEHIFVVDRRLLSATLRLLENKDESTAWEDWGPSCTRWINAGPIVMHHITVTSGQRMVSIPHQAWRLPAPIRILDFNPAHVDAQRAVGPVDGEHALVRVVDDAEAPDWPEHLDAFQEPVVSHLPYVEIVSKEEFDFGAVLINDEDILGARFGQRSIESLEVLHFG
ncbi:hypothetical protein C8R47DRAFT_1107048 [Mycena vitilis]|nr:hypothetical protein C8R47DRAFT_1107048 [Mycena vitilis]